MEEAKVFQMGFTKVYGLLVSKAHKKALISCGFNLHKFHLRSQVKQLAA